MNEVLNGLLLQTQAAAGVTLRRLRTVPVSPSIRLGIVPTGFTNSIARSILGTSCPSIAAAQIMLGEQDSHVQCSLWLPAYLTPGCSTPVDVCSIMHNGQFAMFAAGPMSYGFWSNAALFSRAFDWLGARRFDAGTIRSLLSSQ